ncbi:MAG: di-heme oxidoredictase family protein [Hyphomicrobiaceae bacterium]
MPLGLVAGLASVSFGVGLIMALGLNLAGLSARAAAGAERDPSSLMPGGAATSRGSLDHANAFSHPSGNLEFAGGMDFRLGKAMFRKIWVSAPASTRASSGLGPLYNARSCQSCHIKDGRGHPPEANWPGDDAISMVLRLSIPPRTASEQSLIDSGQALVIPEPTYGTQLQDLAIVGHRGEGRMHITYEEVPVTLADGDVVSLRRPTYTITDLGYGPLHPETMISPRVANPMIGLGLLEAIPEADILAEADRQRRDGDGIAGRPNIVWSIEHGRRMIGRFGWKAASPTGLQQSAEAAAFDIGIGTPMLPLASGDCTNRQAACRAAPQGGTSQVAGVEMSMQLLRLTAFYARNLAVPPRRNADAADVLAGERLFSAIGCASCHVPSFTTGSETPDPNLAGLRIWPYTDLLLHDMGEGLADGRPEGSATGREWRTAPLWGIGLTEIVNGHSYFLHDGRARSLEEAILWHGGTAQAARDRFTVLTRTQREQLIAFLRSL